MFSEEVHHFFSPSGRPADVSKEGGPDALEDLFVSGGPVSVLAGTLAPVILGCA
jgi:hypothetical protein